MTTKLAGSHLPLQDMIASVINDAKNKLAASEEKVEEKKPAKKIEKAEKKEEETEKKSSINFLDHDHISKLASALEVASEKLAANQIDNGGEAKQGGQQLPVGAQVHGEQSNKKDQSAKHNIPLNPGMQGTQIVNNMAKAPGGQAKHAAQIIMQKIAEAKQGGMTLDSASGEGPKPSGDAEARKNIESNQAAVSMQKIDGKKHQKKSLAEVLSEPAQTKSTDSKLHENLRNASSSGVKIAAVRSLLQKIAEEGCSCSDAGTCKYCKLQAAVAKKKESMSENSSQA